MPKTVHSVRHRRLAELITEKRKAAGMTQAEVARAMGRHQPFIANIESGDRRVDLVELLDLARVIGLNIHAAVDQLEELER